jgi:2-methylcitrate dehydratase PrpD
MYTDEKIRDKTIQDLACRVEMMVSNKWEELYPRKRGVTVTITSRDGKASQSEVALAKGEPENPATWEEVYKKFNANAALAIEENQVKTLAETIMDLEHCSINELLDQI